MKPPVCVVCDADFVPGDDGNLVSFEAHEDEEWPPDKTGHPSNEAWFCDAHLDRAQSLTHLTLPEALERFD